jgi:hypothetical protein
VAVAGTREGPDGQAPTLTLRWVAMFMRMPPNDTPEAVIECEARPLLPPTISLTQCPICGCRDWWRAGEDLVGSLVWLNGGLCCVLCHCLVNCVAVVEET